MNLPTSSANAHWSYDEFVAHVDALLADGKTTGTNHTQAYLDYTSINQQRMHRVYKTTTIGPELSAALKNLKQNYVWMVIAEGWCGDVPQNLPVIAKAAEETDHIQMEVILRDENPKIMDQFLTQGGRAIPILVVMHADTREMITHWGPRPAPAQKMVRDYKEIPEGEKQPYMEFVKDVQLWYAHDHTQTMQAELLLMVQGLEK